MALTRPRALQIFDLDYKQAVRVITTSNITLSGGAPNTVDGVSLAAGDRILVNGQGTASQNGIYEVQTLGTGVNGTWTRTVDATTNGTLLAGAIVMVTEGTVYADTQWKLVTNNPIVIGTTALNWEQNSAFAFGNIFANGTAVLANTVGDTLTLSNGNNIVITGNAATKSVTIAVTESPSFSGTLGVTGNITGGNLVTTGETSTGTFRSSGDALINGNLTVQGNLKYINVEDLRIEDPVIIMGTGPNGAPLTTNDGLDRGIYMEYYTTGLGNAFVGWQNSTGNIIIANNVEFASNDVIQVNSYGTLQAGNAYLESAVVVGNITGGNISTSGTLTTTGNLSANNLSATNGITAGTTVVATGNITGGNLTTAGLTSSGTLSVTGNANAGNLGTAGQVTATGNITGGNIVTSGTVNTGSLTASATITATGNVTGGNLITTGLTSTATLSASGNITGGNLNTVGQVVATGNITGGNVTATNLTGTLLTANQPNITDVGTLNNLNVTGNTVSGTGTFGNITISGSNINSNASRITVNSDGADVDFAVDGDTTANVFYVDAGTGTVSVGNSTQTTGATLSINSAASILMPRGNVIQRPSPGTIGMTRYNTEDDGLEIFTQTGWKAVGTQFTVIASETFAGDNSTVAFTLATAQTTDSCIVSINGIVQEPVTAYSVSGTTLTFTEAPLDGDTIEVRTLATTTTITGISNSPGNAKVSTTDTSGNVVVTGDLIPAANVTQNLGANTARWNELYLAGNTITLGDVVIKNTGGNVIGFFGPDGTTPGSINTNNIDSAAISNGTSNVSVVASNGNVNVNIGGSPIVTFYSGGIDNRQANGVGNIGTASSSFNTVFARATSAQYADLAEKYLSDADYAPGTVVVFGGAQEVTESTSVADHRVAGVVSTNPAYIMNSALQGAHVVTVALTGRVPCQVQGPVTKGDLMVSAGHGHAQADNSARAGTIIGKALEDFDGESGVIEIVVGRH